MIILPRKYYSISLLILVLLCSGVDAVMINNTVLNSTGLGTEINITYPWYADVVTVDTNWIYAKELNQSNILGASREALSFNLTLAHRFLTGQQVPYYSSSSNITKIITSPLLDIIAGGPANITVQSCDILRILYTTTDHSNDRNLTGANFTCVGTDLDINNLPFIGFPETRLEIDYNATVLGCNLDFINEFKLLENITASAGLDWTTPHTMYMLRNLSFNHYYLAPDISNITVYVGRGNGGAYLNNPGAGRQGQCYYNFTYTDNSWQQSANWVITGVYSLHNFTNPDYTKPVAEVTAWCNITDVANEGLGTSNDSLWGNVTYNGDTGNYTVEFNIFNETNITQPITSDAEAFFEYWINPAFKYNYSYLWGNVTTGHICIYPDTLQLNGNLYIKHHTSDGFTHRYFVSNEVFNATVHNITIYNEYNTSGYNDLKLTTIHKETYRPYEDVLTYLQRYYPATNEWLTVQMDKSDNFGQNLFNVEQKITDYRFIFRDLNNNLLNMTTTMKFLCNAITGLCEIQIPLSAYVAPVTTPGFNVIYSYSNATKLLTTTWVDTLAMTSLVEVIVTRQSTTGKATICDTPYAHYHGTDNCNLSGYSGEVFLTVTADGVTKTSTWVNLGKTGLYSFISAGEGAFWTVGILVIIIGVGLFSPAGALISLVIGMIFIYFLGIFKPLNMIVLITTAIIVIVLSWKLKK